jgi:hypothetical protein
MEPRDAEARNRTWAMGLVFWKVQKSTMDETEIIDWLLEGDVSIQYQAYRDLLDTERPELLGISPDIEEIRQTISLITQDRKSEDGGINPAKTIKQSDVCVNGMFLNYACYFHMPEAPLQSVVDFLTSEQMPDGGFNCQSNQGGAVHSSLHTTLSVLEGILEYARNGYTYRLAELERMAAESREFILQHRLFRSDHTGEVIDQKFLMLSYPSRWRYDILRALDYFQDAGIAYDPRMQDALNV